MPISILMPALSPTMTEGNLIKWHKQMGDAVKAGDILAEIETDKATMEVEAVDEGKLAAILVAAGTSSVKVNAPIAVLLEEGENETDLQSILTSLQAQTPQEISPSEMPSPTAAPGPSSASHSLQIPEGDGTTAPARTFASPLARRLAEQNQINLTHVQGSGPRGRVVKQDILNALTHPSSQKTTLALNVSDPSLFTGFEPSFQEIPVSMMRKVIARRLSESKQQVPHFYVSTEVLIDELLCARQTLNCGRESKISVNDMVIQATARALKQYPAVNAAWAGETIRIFDRIDIAVAVSLEDGLITPIIRGANLKGLNEISAEMKELAARARAGKLQPQEFQGGTFSLSNLGMFGVEQFNAIVNPPQAAILAVGAGIPKPVVREGQIGIATCMNLTLSLDHRAVDGALGAQFLSAIKDFLEQPARMLL